MVLTGAYHGHAHVIDLQRRVNTTISTNFKDKRGKQCGFPRYYKNKRLLGTVPATEMPANIIGGSNASNSSKGSGIPSSSNNSSAATPKDVGMVDMTKGSAPKQTAERSSMTPSNNLQLRISMGAWHPKDNTFAVAKHNSLFIYSEKRSISTHDKKMAREREREREVVMQN